MQPLWRTAWRLLKKLKIELPREPAIPLLGIYLDKTIIQNDTSSPVFTVTLFRIECPSLDEWIKKIWYVYTRTMEYYSAIKKNETCLSAATCLQLEIIILSEINQKEKDKYMLLLICGI